MIDVVGGTVFESGVRGLIDGTLACSIYASHSTLHGGPHTMVTPIFVVSGLVVAVERGVTSVHQRLALFSTVVGVRPHNLVLLYHPITWIFPTLGTNHILLGVATHVKLAMSELHHLPNVGILVRTTLGHVQGLRVLVFKNVVGAVRRRTQLDSVSYGLHGLVDHTSCALELATHQDLVSGDTNVKVLKMYLIVVAMMRFNKTVIVLTSSVTLMTSGVNTNTHVFSGQHGLLPFIVTSRVRIVISTHAITLMITRLRYTMTELGIAGTMIAIVVLNKEKQDGHHCIVLMMLHTRRELTIVVIVLDSVIIVTCGLLELSMIALRITTRMVIRVFF